MTDTFRTAGDTATSPLDSFPDVQKSKGPVLSEKADSKAGIYTHKSVTGQPITVDHFNLKTFWDSPTANMTDQIEQVDEWVQEKARERSLEDKPESYNEIIDEVLKQIGKSDNEKPHKTFERVAKAIDALKRLEEAKLPPVLNVNSMTADEYKKTRG